MPKAIATKLPDPSEWVTEALRLSAFHQLGPQKDDHDWWETIVGATPESKNLKPREGGYEVSGSHARGLLTLKADAVRFDWLYTANPPIDKPPAGVVNAGPLADALEVFLPLMRTWLANVPAVHRLAFGAVVRQHVENRIEGYKLLDAYLPYIELDIEHSSEFSYSINRHRTADAFEGLHINRLSKWSVAHFQQLTLMLVGGKADSVPGQAFDALRLELDINTDGERKEALKQDQLPSLLDYLANLAKEISEKGDIK